MTFFLNNRESKMCLMIRPWLHFANVSVTRQSWWFRGPQRGHCSCSREGGSALSACRKPLGASSKQASRPAVRGLLWARLSPRHKALSRYSLIKSRATKSGCQRDSLGESLHKLHKPLTTVLNSWNWYNIKCQLYLNNNCLNKIGKKLSGL